MKRWVRHISVFLVVCLMLPVLAAGVSAAPLTYTDEYGTWTYQIEEDGSATILECKTTKKNIVIPASIDGRNVKKLGHNLFQDNDTITGVVIPHGVEEIDERVFFDCDKLEHVEIPNSVTVIGEQAFAKCESIETLYIPSSVEELGDKVFEDSPNIDVQCPVNSEAAAYLEQNKSDVANYTLIEVKPENPVPQPQPGVAPGGTNPPAINGKLVTYTFGKTVNGQPEFTFVVADANPNLDLMHYVETDEYGNVTAFMGDELRNLMRNRFQLVSMSRYDGKNTITHNFNKEDTWLVVDTSMYNYLDEAGKPCVEVLYHFSINFVNDTYVDGFPIGLEFSSDNEMLTYSTVVPYFKQSMVKRDDDYVFYRLGDEAFKRYDAVTGTLLVSSQEKSANVHRFGVEGSCVDIVIRKAEFQEPNGYRYNHEYKEVIVTDPETKTIVDAVSNTDTRHDGTMEVKNSTRIEVVDNVVVGDQFFHANYDQNGNLMEAYKESRTKGSQAGTYNVTNTIGKVTEKWTMSREEHRTEPNGNHVDVRFELDCQDTNRVVYSDTVVKADNVQDAMGKVSQDFPNEPDQREDHVSYRYVNTVELHKETGMQKDLNTGVETTVNNLQKTETLKNYTYIGDTGKYVGWDWTWNYSYADDTAAANGDAVLTRYTVTEYKYSADTDTWTKTQTQASAKNPNTGSTIDFKNTDTNTTPTLDQILEDYELHSESYVFDPVDSGMDNWKKTGDDHVRSYSDRIDHNHNDMETGINIHVDKAENEQTGNIWVDGTLYTDENQVTGDAKEVLEEMPAQLEEITDAILGVSEVTTADGTDLTQNEVKEEMLELSEDMKREAFEETDFFEETVTDTVLIPDGKELADAAEEVLDSGKLPESNTDKAVDHYHNDDGTTETIITEKNPQQLALAAEPAAPAAEPAAPAAEPAAPAAEPAAPAAEPAAPAGPTAELT